MYIFAIMNPMSERITPPSKEDFILAKRGLIAAMNEMVTKAMEEGNATNTNAPEGVVSKVVLSSEHGTILAWKQGVLIGGCVDLAPVLDANRYVEVAPSRRVDYIQQHERAPRIWSLNGTGSGVRLRPTLALLEMNEFLSAMHDARDAVSQVTAGSNLPK